MQPALPVKPLPSLLARGLRPPFSTPVGQSRAGRVGLSAPAHSTVSLEGEKIIPDNGIALPSPTSCSFPLPQVIPGPALTGCCHPCGDTRTSKHTWSCAAPWPASGWFMVSSKTRSTAGNLCWVERNILIASLPALPLAPAPRMWCSALVSVTTGCEEAAKVLLLPPFTVCDPFFPRALHSVI